MRASPTAAMLAFVIALLLSATPVAAMTIGYYDGTREAWGFSGNNYLSDAKQWLTDQGHTLVATSRADASFLSGVDAFYTGLVRDTYFEDELDAFEEFVGGQGGFLFVQQDWGPNNHWHAAAQQLLGRWDIGTEGSHNSSQFQTVGTSDWVSDPNAVAAFSGAYHAVITSGEEQAGYERLAHDTADRSVLGVFDAGAGRSSDVLVSTDINMWDNSYGWTDAGSRDLWANIWQNAEDQTNEDPVPEPATLMLLGAGLVGFAAGRMRRRKP